MKIRRKQLQVLSQNKEDAFVDSVMAYLREEYPDHVEGLADLYFKEMVENGLTRARRYGLTWEMSLTAFVALMFKIAPNFDEHQEIMAVLTDEQIPPDNRIEELTRRVSDEAWREAEHSYNPDAWFPYDDLGLEEND